MTDFPLTTTLNRIYALRPCRDSWEIGLQAAGKTAPDDEPITYERILDAVGVQSALWVCRAEPQHGRLWRLYAVWCARRVQHLMTDARSLAALDVAERYANGQATDAELFAANAAAKTASKAVDKAAIWGATGTPAEAAATTAAWDATKATGWAAASDAAWAAASAAGWVADEDFGVDWDAGKSAECQAQTDAFRQLVTTGTLP